MAKIEDILQLKEAGFTAEEISNLLSVISISEEKKEAEKPPVVETVKDTSQTDKLYDRIGQLIDKIEATNLSQTNMPELNKRGAEDILASIISPNE